MMKASLQTRAALLVAGALAAIAVAWAILGLASAGETAAVGDANCDGAVNSIDAALVLQLHAGLIEEVCGEVDVNGDGEVDSIDAFLILQMSFSLQPLKPLTPTPTESPPEPTQQPSGDLIAHLKMGDLIGNDGVAVSLTLANKNPWPVKREYATGQRYDVVVRDAEGDYVWNWFHDSPFTQAIESHVWEPGEWVTYSAAWQFEDKQGNPVEPGTYELFALDVGCAIDSARQCDFGETVTIDIPPPPDCTGQDGLGADLILSGDRKTFSSGENVSLTLVLFNCGDTMMTRGYSSAQMYDFVIQDEAGQIVWHWSHAMVFAQIGSGRTFEPGEMVVYRTIWRQDTDERPALLAPELFNRSDLVAPGAYQVFGFDVDGCRYQELANCDLIASQTLEILP